MANPNFTATMSSNEIWRDLDDTRCITDDLDAIEDDISELQTGKANSDHTHSYNELSDKPTIPPDYTHPENHPASMITGLATVATTGNYDDLNGKPIIPVVPFIEDTTYPGCFYRIVNGATEWINPPLIAGVEYRTTERWNGNPVYTQSLPIGTWAKGGVVDYDISPHVIRYNGRIGNWTLPFINNSTDNTYSVWATFYNNAGKLRLGMCGGTNANGSGGHIQIWYYKV